MTVYEKIVLTAWAAMILLFFFAVIWGIATDFRRSSEVILKAVAVFAGLWFLCALPIVGIKIWGG